MFAPPPDTDEKPSEKLLGQQPSSGSQGQLGIPGQGSIPALGPYLRSHSQSFNVCRLFI